MTKVNIISGFLGAGKTTFIKRLIGDVFKGEKLVLIENEFGEIGVDGDFLKESGIEITEMNSGCICCSLVGDFTKALGEVVNKLSPHRILIEPSGVGKLSDVIKAVEALDNRDVEIDNCITVADCTKCKMYARNFGEFYKDQIINADCVLLTRTDKADEHKIHSASETLRDINEKVTIITTPLSDLNADEIRNAFNKVSMEDELMEEVHSYHDHDCGCHHHEHEHHDRDCGCHHHEHEHHDHDCGCHHHEHGHHDHDCECHHHEHGHHDHDCGCHHHEHGHHDHDCGCHHHEHEHHNHHADDTFTSWGRETAAFYTAAELESILTAFDSGAYGTILRAKGMVASEDGWIYFDYVPFEHGIRSGSPCYTGKICVIGAELDTEGIAALFDKE